MKFLNHPLSGKNASQRFIEQSWIIFTIILVAELGIWSKSRWSMFTTHRGIMVLVGKVFMK